MTNEQILTKAIEKAIAGGWDFFGLIPHGSGRYIWFNSPLSNRWDVRSADGVIFSDNIEKTNHSYEIIFNHDFARAIWGDRSNIENWPSAREDDPGDYLYHLREMVIADDPLAYLGAHL
jgi:hypothetical protein